MDNVKEGRPFQPRPMTAADTASEAARVNQAERFAASDLTNVALGPDIEFKAGYMRKLAFGGSLGARAIWKRFSLHASAVGIAFDSGEESNSQYTLDRNGDCHDARGRYTKKENCSELNLDYGAAFELEGLYGPHGEHGKERFLYGGGVRLGYQNTPFAAIGGVTRYPSGFLFATVHVGYQLVSANLTWTFSQDRK